MEAGRAYLEGERDAMFTLAPEEPADQPIASAPFDDLNFDP